jgi:hypothetical protein
MIIIEDMSGLLVFASLQIHYHNNEELELCSSFVIRTEQGEI